MSPTDNASRDLPRSRWDHSPANNMGWRGALRLRSSIGSWLREASGARGRWQRGRPRRVEVDLDDDVGELAGELFAGPLDHRACVVFDLPQAFFELVI